MDSLVNSLLGNNENFWSAYANMPNNYGHQWTSGRNWFYSHEEA